MMQILLDENPFSDVTGPSIGHIVEAANAQANTRGRILVEVIFDGEPMSPDSFALPVENAAANAMSETPTLQLITADPFDVVMETAQQASTALDRVISLQVESAEQIQAGNVAEALTPLLEALQIWEQIQRTVDIGAEMAHLDLAAIRNEDEAFDEAIVTLTRELSEMKRALKDQDFVALSDSLAYEMGPIVEQWRGLLGKFATLIAEERARRAA